MEVTASRYDGMQARMAKKELPPLPFTKDEFRSFVREKLGSDEGGVVQCRYCRGYFNVEQLAVDHVEPLHRGGWIGLENLDLPCQPCNARKGAMTPDEFLKLLRFLETEIPLARTDVLSRLEKSVKLAAGARRNAVRIRELKQSGHWKKPKAKVVEEF